MKLVWHGRKARVKMENINPSFSERYKPSESKWAKSWN